MPFTYYLLGNEQIFDNKLYEIKKYGDPSRSEHKFFDFHILNNEGNIAYNSSPLILLLVSIVTMPFILYYFRKKDLISKARKVEDSCNH